MSRLKTRGKHGRQFASVRVLYVAQPGNSDRLKMKVPQVENASAVTISVITLGPIPAIAKSLVFM